MENHNKKIRSETNFKLKNLLTRSVIHCDDLSCIDGLIDLESNEKRKISIVGRLTDEERNMISGERAGPSTDENPSADEFQY
jgi:hypothetical protein